MLWRPQWLLLLVGLELCMTTSSCYASHIRGVPALTRFNRRGLVTKGPSGTPADPDQTTVAGGLAALLQSSELREVLEKGPVGGQNIGWELIVVLAC